MFEPLPDKPDHQALELAILDRWAAEQTFEQVRAANADGPRFSFIDGPVTANKTLGVHTAWGRTLKDAFQRYKALRGFHQRYQNGFDCQGLWIEVGVERDLGLNSKREIEEYGLAEFAARCREVVERSSAALTEGSIRLGQWMDWDRSYFTFSDTNIAYIWKFLAIVNEKGWLYRGHRPTEWCPRCGTSISAHELVGSYIDREDPSLTVRFPLLDRPGESIVIWTTTPWTLPANVAAAVRPDARYGLRDGEWRAVDRWGDGPFDDTKLGAELEGWRYEGPFDAIGPGGEVDHRVVVWDEVSMDEGTGVVHIAPGCGAEDFTLGRSYELPVLMPVDESGRFTGEYGWLSGQSTTEARDAIIADLDERGRLVEAGTIEHRFPECWRCHTPLIFRVSDDWFIGVAEIREPLREANAGVTWVPSYMGKRMDDWLVNMGDWNISRRRYYGMPLPFYPCTCGHLTVITSKEELLAKATAPVAPEDLPELRRPWIDAVKIRCDACGADAERVPEVGDVWLDAGIVPFSTLGWENPSFVEAGYATGAAQGLTVADLPAHETWAEWFPADWVSEMREQIRLWFYSQLFMSVALTGQAPYKRVLGYEKMLDEHGVEMHGSHGNMIPVEDAFARMGADVMRWQYCQQPPNQNLLFGFAPGQEIQRRLITLWNSASFFVQYANIAGFTPSYAELATGPGGERDGLDTWLVERVAQLVTEATQGFEDYLTVNVLRAFEAGLDDLSNWYIRRSRRRFWDGEDAALRSLWYALVQSIRVIAPITPFLAEHLWAVLVAGPCPDAPRSIFLAGWPEVAEPDAEVLADGAALRAVVDLGRQARAASSLRLRQPLRRMVVDGADRLAGHVGEIADELRVKEVELGSIDATDLRVRPNLPVLAPRLGAAIRDVRAALADGQFEALGDGGFRVAGHDLTAEEVLVERVPKEGWAFASADGVVVAIDTTLDDELVLEARVYDLIHHVNNLRKETGLELTDRIAVTLAATDADLLAHRDWIARETLATSLDAGTGTEVTITKA